ncbi:uncharacterized protein LOC107048808 [Diachasma alloeum]|uniref:uncharacterized protein LOC107048808 n=1 Tax=Diachasma alloeum TaxID=454923 RepID=UPI0007381147|nr:uncharacterized protein LOC107048808 [Diachasma alloeum]
MLAKTIVLVACIAAATALPVPLHEATWVSIYKKCILNAVRFISTSAMEPGLQVCVMKEAGTMTEDGVWKVEQIIDFIPKEEPKYDGIVSTMRTCAQEATGKTEGETAMFLPKCLAEKLPCEDHPCHVTANLLVVLNASMLPTVPQRR